MQDCRWLMAPYIVHSHEKYGSDCALVLCISTFKNGASKTWVSIFIVCHYRYSTSKNTQKVFLFFLHQSNFLAKYVYVCKLHFNTHMCLGNIENVVLLNIFIHA